MNLQDTYRDITEIGSGGGGTVFRAYHIRMQKYVVLKKIHDFIQQNVDIRGELNILKNLRHSYLPTVLDFIEDNGAIYTVMDYIPGESFESMLERGVRFPQAKVVKYAAQLAEVLSYLHGQATPVIHGDIKPANIMLTPEDNICLIDFNISQLGGSYDAAGLNKGFTPCYASPEQVAAVQEMYARMAAMPTVNRTKGGTVLLDAQPGGSANAIPQMPAFRGKMDERTDIYSVGATLYALVTGQAPNPDFSQIVPVTNLVEDCSEGLAYLIQKCMQFQPSKRFANAGELVKAVAAIAKVDKRYKRLVRRQDFTVVFCILGVAAGIILSILGREQLQKERVEVYFDLVEQMEELQAEGIAATEELEELYEEATDREPARAEAYYQKAVFLYRSMQYEELQIFVEDEVFTHGQKFKDEDYGEFYFLMANGCLEMGELDEAISKYKTSLRYDGGNGECYANYAIALARNGELDEAERILEKAVKKGFTSDNILLAEGEIKGRQGFIEEAEACFEQCLSETRDDYVAFRAYVIWGKLYSDAENPTAEMLQKGQQIFDEASERVAEEYRTMVLEQLAQISIDLGAITGNEDEYRKALKCFEQIADSGWDTYVTHSNIAAIYQRLGDYSAAHQEFTDMLDEFGEDYRTYKNLAFLEIDIQAARENANRDYGQFLNYYKKAFEAFEKSGVRADSDMEMQLLQQVYGQLKDGNWLTE